MFFYLRMNGTPSPILKDLRWKNIVKLWSDPLCSHCIGFFPMTAYTKRKSYYRDSSSRNVLSSTNCSVSVSIENLKIYFANLFYSIILGALESVKSHKPQRVFLPVWCRYVAWLLCALIIAGCSTITVLYGFRYCTSYILCSGLLHWILQGHGNLRFRP